MSRAYAVLPCALLAGCLLAPERPDGGSAPTIDGLPADAYAGGPFCPGSGDVFGASVAFDRAGSGYDSIYRVGIGSALGPLLARWDDPAHGSACADQAARLGPTQLGIGATVNALTVVDIGGGQVLAYVLASAGSAAELHALTDTGPLTDTVVYAEPGLAPTAVPNDTAAADHPAFVSYVDQGNMTGVWFGGGSALGVVHPGRTTPPADGDQAVFAGSASVAPYYAVAQETMSDHPIGLVGYGGAVDASVLFGTDPLVNPHGTPVEFLCPTTTCTPRLARAVNRADLPVAAYIVDDSVHQIGVLQRGGVFVTGGITAPSSTIGTETTLVDTDGDDIDGDQRIDVAGLYTATLGTAAEVTLDIGVGSAVQPPLVATIETVSATHVVMIRRGGVHDILVFGPQGASEACLTVGSGSGAGSALVVCPP